MDSTVQQRYPESIGEHLDTLSEKTDPAQVTEHWSDQQWRENPLPNSITNRLARIDRALQGIEAIHTLLHRNWRAKAEQWPAYEALSPIMVEGLHVALEGLHGIAVASCESVRMNEFGICGARR